MNKKMSVRTIIRIVSFSLASFIVLGGFAIAGYNTANYYKDTLEYTYERALDELSNHIANIESTLAKGMYANTSIQQHNLYSKLFSQSESAKSSLSQLPLDTDNLSNINKFISQIGDFSLYISKKASKGEKLNSDDINNIKILYEYSKNVNNDMQDITAKYSIGNLSIIQEKGIFNNSNHLSSEPYLINTGFHNMNEGFTDFPTLLYDGPFSDHITQAEPKLLKDKTEITQNDAINKASQFTGIEKSKISVSGENNGNLETFNLTSNNIDISITKRGGYISSIINSRPVSNSLLGYKQASAKAKEFLSNHNINNISENYYVISNNICTINFAYEKDDITYYSDLIKVGIALDNGEIISLNTTGYIMNHFERNLTNNIISKDSAQNNISPLLNVESINLACIPTGLLDEVLCYEFNCTSEIGQNVLVYINAQTGMEENILILLKEDNGILTI